MKNLTNSEIAQAKKIAYNFTYSLQNLLMNKAFKSDRRTRIGQLAVKIERTIRLSSEQKRANIAVIRSRNKAQYIFTNVLTSGIVKDYLKNKGNIKAIESNRIRFADGRNHYSNNIQVLNILAKYI